MMDLSTVAALASVAVVVLGNGGFGYWLHVSSRDRRIEIDDHFEKLDACVHRIELSVTSALKAFEAQVPSRSEMENRIAKETAARERDVDRIDRTLEQHR